MSAVEGSLDDFAEIVKEYYDENITRFTEFKKAIEDTHEFYLKPTEIGKKLYQYDKANQKQYQDTMVVIKRALGFVYPVLRDLNDMFKVSQEKIDENVEKVKTETKNPSVLPYVQSSPVIVNTGNQQKEGLGSKFKNALFGESKVEELPMELKDSWMMSRDLQLELINQKQLIKQILNWHNAGVRLAYRFDNGVDKYLNEEADFWTELIETDLLMLVERGLELLKRAKIDSIERMYGTSLQTHQAEKQMSMFTQ